MGTLLGAEGWLVEIPTSVFGPGVVMDGES